MRLSGGAWLPRSRRTKTDRSGSRMSKLRDALRTRPANECRASSLPRSADHATARQPCEQPVIARRCHDERRPLRRRLILTHRPRHGPVSAAPIGEATSPERGIVMRGSGPLLYAASAYIRAFSREVEPSLKKSRQD